MVLPHEENDTADYSARLTRAQTALLTRARTKTIRTQGKEKAELPRGRTVSLLVTEGPFQGESYPIQKPQIVIGRADGDIVIKDPKISRLHCVVEVHGMSALVVDLNSGNGTFLNGRKVASFEIEHMAEFQIGKTTLMYVVGGR